MVENLEKKYKEILKWGALQGITDTPFPSSPSSSPPSSSSSSYRPDFEQQQEQSSCLGFTLEIALFSDSEGGRGLAATRDLKKGEIILRVPKGALLSVHSAQQDKKLAEALVSYPSLSSTQVLCVHLLMEVAKGRTSAWYPYLVHLPRLHHTLAYYTTSVESQALQVEQQDLFLKFETAIDLRHNHSIVSDEIRLQKVSIAWQTSGFTTLQLAVCFPSLCPEFFLQQKLRTQIFNNCVLLEILGGLLFTYQHTLSGANEASVGSIHTELCH